MVVFDPPHIINFFSKGLEFPCYRTIKIHNETSTSTIFEFNQTDENFQIYPRSGYIKGIINPILALINRKRHQDHFIAVLPDQETENIIICGLQTEHDSLSQNSIKWVCDDPLDFYFEF